MFVMEGVVSMDLGVTGVNVIMGGKYQIVELPVLVRYECLIIV